LPLGGQHGCVCTGDELLGVDLVAQTTPMPENSCTSTGGVV